MGSGDIVPQVTPRQPGFFVFAGLEEVVGTVDVPPEQVEQLLWDAGVTRMPLAALKTLRFEDTGAVETGSWAFRDSLLARRRIHVMLFAVDGQTVVAAHAEANALNHLDRARALSSDCRPTRVRTRFDGDSTRVGGGLSAGRQN